MNVIDLTCNLTVKPATIFQERNFVHLEVPQLIHNNQRQSSFIQSFNSYPLGSYSYIHFSLLLHQSIHSPG